MHCELLIVVDDPDELAALSRRFIQAGYQVTGVRHPRQALEVATFRTFQVAIIDSALPEMNGVELMRRLRRMLGNVQVVIQACDSRTAPSARSMGAFACLMKPWQQSLLESTVKSAFEHSTKELPVGIDRQVPVTA